MDREPRSAFPPGINFLTNRPLGLQENRLMSSEVSNLYAEGCSLSEERLTFFVRAVAAAVLAGRVVSDPGHTCLPAKNPFTYSLDLMKSMWTSSLSPSSYSTLCNVRQDKKPNMV